MSAPKSDQASTAAANVVLPDLVSQIETAIKSLGSGAVSLPAAVSQEWIAQLASLTGQQ
jgi:hypothetical protein